VNKLIKVLRVTHWKLKPWGTQRDVMTHDVTRHGWSGSCDRCYEEEQSIRKSCQNESNSYEHSICAFRTFIR